MLICDKDVGDFKVGDVMPYTDVYDINILTLLGVAHVESPRPGEPPPTPPPGPGPKPGEPPPGTPSTIRAEKPIPPSPDEEPEDPREPEEEPEEEIKPRRKSIKAELGDLPQSPDEYHTRVMNEERMQNKKRRR